MGNGCVGNEKSLWYQGSQGFLWDHRGEYVVDGNNLWSMGCLVYFGWRDVEEMVAWLMETIAGSYVT